MAKLKALEGVNMVSENSEAKYPTAGGKSPPLGLTLTLAPENSHSKAVSYAQHSPQVPQVGHLWGPVSA